jgi:serine/threonine protein kinase
LDDFELLQILGEGSFGRVYLAEQVSLGRQVALKVLANRGNEARTMASLEHDHIIRVFAETVRDNLRLLCMQYVPGTNLDCILRFLARLPQLGRPSFPEGDR